LGASAPGVRAAAGAGAEGQRRVCEIATTGSAPLDQLAELGALHAANGNHVGVTACVRFGDERANGGAAARDPGAWLVGVSGIKVVEPATPADATGLVTAAVRAPDPVCVLLHASLYDSVGVVPEGSHMVEIGRSRLAREGERVTLVAHGPAVGLAERAAKEIDLDADLIDLRSLQPRDADGVLTSVRKTGKVVIVEPDPSAARVTAELVAAVWGAAFEHLDAPLRRVVVDSWAAVEDGAAAAEPIMEACLELLTY
jgi:pyruvate dehydrogenase E1 component beta subunit